VFESRRASRAALSGNRRRGPLHTSAMPCCLPEAVALDDVVLNPADLRSILPRLGRRRQHVNKTNSAIRVTHCLPVLVECQYSRSHTRREKALGLLAARIRRKQLRERRPRSASTLKLLIGSGDRSERIRTYISAGPRTDNRSTSRSQGSPHHGRLARRADRRLSADQQAEHLAQLSRIAALR